MIRGLGAGMASILLLGMLLVPHPASAQTSSAAAGVDVVLVLDQSGSMKGNDPQRLMVQSARDLVRKLGPGDAAGLVFFGAQARAAHPLVPLAVQGQRESLVTEIDRIRYADPRTNIAAGIERGMYELKQHGRADAVPILIFITDGIVDTGSAAKDAEMRDWLRSRLLPEAAQRGIRIFSVALTEEADFALIQEMASATGGDYYRAITAREIAGIFASILTKIQERRVAAPSPQPLAPGPVAAPSPAPGPVLALWWLWVVIAAGLAMMLVAGVIMARRLRPAPAPAAPAAPSIPPPAPVRVEAPVPPANLREVRTGKIIQLARSVVRIGRQRDNDLVIAERQVSGHHAEIECRQGHFYLRDLRSTNGTWINKQRIEIETMLKSGDVIRFDQFAFVFSGPDVAAGGTMMRDVRDLVDVREKTLVTEAPRPRPPAPALSETAIVDTDATVDDSVGGPARCPSHGNFEATERCEKCGTLWCALCVPPPPAERVCRRCREIAAGHAKGPAAHSGGSH